MTNSLPVTIWNYEPVSPDAVKLYRLAWQIERWFRMFLYVELRADRVDWEKPLAKFQKSLEWMKADKSLHHMATPHESTLSYLAFGVLWKLIKEEWALFEPYFPPQQITEGRIEEIENIRNRFAHFREPHANDVRRFELFLRDMEPGVRKFCNRYASPVALSDPARDPVSEILEDKWDHVGYGVELHRPDHNWLYAPNRMRPLLHASLNLLVPPTFTKTNRKGLIYKLTVHPPIGSKMDVVTFVGNAKRHHRHIVHILIGSDCNEVQVTLPAVIGVNEVAESIGELLGLGVDATRSSSYSSVADSMDQWPEYILRPGHLLSFFDDVIKAPILELEEPST